MARSPDDGAQYRQLLYLEVLNNHSGLAISPTLIGSLVVMGGVWFVPLGAVAVGLIIKWFDWLYELGNRESNRYKAAILHSFCFGAIFNMIVLAREGLDSFGSRVVFPRNLWYLLAGGETAVLVPG